VLAGLLAMTLAAAQGGAQPPAPGVSEQLARQRASSITDLRYDVTFVIPSDRSVPVRGRAIVRFMLSAPGRVVLDFAQPRDRVRSVRSLTGVTPFTHDNGHIIIPPEFTRSGRNELIVEFVAGDEALNRNDEFLYTLFVPARARLTFPCFDQPDLKARYTLTLDVPAAWQAAANAREIERTPPAEGRTRVRFAETEPLPTYLFAFVAGRFAVEEATRNGRQMRVLHRETDPARIARNREAIFDLHATALQWLERYTEIRYPFGKFDLVLIPSFQFSGMEHAGAILYNASSLLLDESATQNQRLDRASVIAHETAHMWFGDLVTMRWFDDVWMKEVFANFMAAKIVNPSFPEVNHDLRFLLSHYPSAYSVDRTAGTNPIRQSLGNLAEAGQLYGPIIYQKAPVVMRQLELIVGEDGLREGLRDYLKRYAFGNAAWPDLIQILDARTPMDLAVWSRAWVDERGRPTFTTSIQTDTQGKVSALTLETVDPLSRGLVWPQRLRVALGYEAGVRVFTADAAGHTTAVADAVGLERPLFVLPNGEGLGYGLFVLDSVSRDFLIARIEEVPDALTRGSAWVTLWDNLLEGQVAPRVFMDAGLRALPAENDEQNADRVLGYLTRTFWRFLTDEDRAEIGPVLEAALRRGLERASTASQKAVWFNAYRDTALSSDALAWLARIWRREEQVTGLPLVEPDEIALALELAVREVPGWAAILRMQFVMPALSADASQRERAFDRLKSVDNRRREPWVLESLRYLNHPLRAAHGQRFVRPALDLLHEIQQTGDIFFPTRWMESTLYGHRAPEVAGIVRQFLSEQPAYPERLRRTILSAADELFRSAEVGGMR
jgi:aminopeptidase N